MTWALPTRTYHCTNGTTLSGSGEQVAAILTAGESDGTIPDYLDGGECPSIRSVVMTGDEAVSFKTTKGGDTYYWSQFGTIVPD